MTPRKKDDKGEEKENNFKKTKEHIFTKAELIADLKKDKTQGFFSRMFFGASREQEKERGASDSLEKKVPVEKSQQAGKKIEVKKEEICPFDITEIKKEKKMPSPFLDALQEVPQKAVPPKKKKMVASVSAKQILNFRNELAEGRKEIKKENSLKIKKEEKKEAAPLLEIRQQEILDLFTVAVRSGDEGKLNEAVEKLARLRSEDGLQCQNDAALNVAIRQELFKSIQSSLAYKGIKEMVKSLQLMDTLNLEITPADFSILPSEVLESSEMHVAAIRYLIWCAKEYEQSPADFEKRIACFAASRILTFDEVEKLPEIQDVILHSIFEYAKNHLKNPSEISRKIYQYSLAGFLNASDLKKSEKVRQLIKSYLVETIERYQDRPEEIERKIREYETAGFIQRQDLRDDEKIKRTIEKQLGRYIKVNRDHPRKVSARVKEYLTMGLVTKEEAENFLKNA